MLAPSEPAMCGRATLAIEVSSTSIKAANATVMAMSQGLTRGFHATWADACGLGLSLEPGAVTAGAADADSDSGKKTAPWGYCREAMGEFLRNSGSARSPCGAPSTG